MISPTSCLSRISHGVRAEPFGWGRLRTLCQVRVPCWVWCCGWNLWMSPEEGDVQLIRVQGSCAPVPAAFSLSDRTTVTEVGGALSVFPQLPRAPLAMPPVPHPPEKWETGTVTGAFPCSQGSSGRGCGEGLGWRAPAGTLSLFSCLEEPHFLSVPGYFTFQTLC